MEMNRKIVVALASLLLAACGSKDAGSASAACPTNQLLILFNPMFTAFDGMHPFKIPAVVDNMSAAGIKWSATDPSMVDIVDDPTVGGVMISPRKAGTTNIVASAGTQCGVAPLTITSATPDDWNVGNMRYNNGIVLTGPLIPGRNPDGGVGKDVACTNCHGDTATMGPFRTVAHTPQQTGGFSDDDLLSIFTRGMVPVGGYFDSSVVPYNQWRGFHTWQMTQDEAKGVIVYLRSLTPQAQTGQRGDFGGRRGRDGGVPPPPNPNPPTPISLDSGTTD
jgi:hypothetical protein